MRVWAFEAVALAAVLPALPALLPAAEAALVFGGALAAALAATAGAVRHHREAALEQRKADAAREERESFDRGFDDLERTEKALKVVHLLMHNKPNESPELREKAHAVRFATSLYRKIGDHALTDVAAGASPKNLSPLARKLHKRRSNEERDDDDDGRWRRRRCRRRRPRAHRRRPSLIAGASTFAAVPGYDPPVVRQHRTTSWPASFVTRSGKLAALDALDELQSEHRVNPAALPLPAAAADDAIDEEHTAAPAAARLPGRRRRLSPTSAPAAACGPRSPRAPRRRSTLIRTARGWRRRRRGSATLVLAARLSRRHARVLPGASSCTPSAAAAARALRTVVGRRVQADGRRADGGVVLPAPRLPHTSESEGLDGQRGFCFGCAATMRRGGRRRRRRSKGCAIRSRVEAAADSDGDGLPERAAELRKRLMFRDALQWGDVEALLIDARILRRASASPTARWRSTCRARRRCSRSRRFTTS